MTKTRIIVVGGGAGGLELATRLGDKLGRNGWASVIVLGFLIGFGVKMPIVPLHGWLPLAHVEAPSPISILLSGILLKMGSYGLIRAVEMLPAAALAMQQGLMLLALFSLLASRPRMSV